MSFRRRSNAHDRWAALVRESSDLHSEVPRAALARESAFRDYVTSGVHRGTKFAPSVFELSPDALTKLWTFINHRARFDMDASLFDDFNEAFRRSRAP